MIRSMQLLISQLLIYEKHSFSSSISHEPTRKVRISRLETGLSFPLSSKVRIDDASASPSKTNRAGCNKSEVQESALVLRPLGLWDPPSGI